MTAPKLKTSKRTGARQVLGEAMDLGHSKVLQTAEALDREHPAEARAIEERVGRMRQGLGLEPRPAASGEGLAKALQAAADPSPAHPVEPAMILNGAPVPDSLQRPETKMRREARVGTAAAEAPQSAIPDEVAPKELRKALRDSLQARLEAIKSDMAASRKERDLALQKIRALNKEKANPATTALETPQARRQRIEAELEAARDELHAADVGRELGADYVQTLRLLEATERDYYLALTAAASRTESYGAVASRGTADWGRGSDHLEVDHIFPRSRIFLLPGFEKRPWPVQVEMFAYSENLKLIDATANSSRGATPYAKLSREFKERFGLSSAQQKDLADLEAEMELFFGQWASTGRRPSRTP